VSIGLQELVKSYGGVTTVDRVSVEIPDGELFALLGASGSGKSTLLRMIAGLVPVDSGRILLEGKDVTDLPPQQRHTGFVFQDYSLFPHMTVAQNVEFGLAVRRTPRKERIERRDEMLALVGLTGFGRRYPRQLSGGQQQRVALARALAFRPTVLLLDEPLGALDVSIRGQLRRSLRQLQRALGITTILVTHDQEEAFELADRIGVFERGRLLEVGRPQELYRHPKRPFVAAFVGDANLFGARVQDGRVNIGEFTAEAGTVGGDRPADSRGVLFRPEDLELASAREALVAPALGEGVIEESTELGPSRRIHVRLHAIPGVWPLGRDYGESGLPVRATAPTGVDAPDFARGSRVWVGARSHHLLELDRIRILLAVKDPAGRDADAVHLAAAIAPVMDASLTVLLVGAGSGAQLPPEIRSRVREVRPAEGRSRSREIFRELAREAYDFVIVGGRKESSVTAARRRIAGRSPVSVLFGVGARLPIRKVLLCTAAGEAGKLDVFRGGDVARALGATVTLLYVDDPAFAADSKSRRGQTVTSAWIDRHIRDGIETLQALGVAAESKIRRGDSLSEIRREAQDGEADLIVIGGHWRRTRLTGRDRDLPAEVVARSDRPVLVVKGA
jgi:sulfate transport system ATP-binding protein